MVDSAIRSGLAQLAAMQIPDGSFPLFHHAGTQPPRPCHGLFSTLTVLLAVGDLLPADSRSTALAYVLDQRRADGLWLFDPDLPIPVDADCAACALAALAQHAHPVSAVDADLLRSFWRADGGPFLTWRDAPQEWLGMDRDDAVVNCNVLLALRKIGAPPTAVETRITLELVNRSFRGARYYCSPATIAYAAKRAGLRLESVHPKLRARPRRDGRFLPTAQWLAAVGRWDNRAIARVLSAQSTNGAWTAEDWCQGAGGGRWGSDAVSTALCIEGLQSAARAASARLSRRIFGWLRW